MKEKTLKNLRLALSKLFETGKEFQINDVGYIPFKVKTIKELNEFLWATCWRWGCIGCGADNKCHIEIDNGDTDNASEVISLFLVCPPQTSDEYPEDFYDSIALRIEEYSYRTKYSTLQEFLDDIKAKGGMDAYYDDIRAKGGLETYYDEKLKEKI